MRDLTDPRTVSSMTSWTRLEEDLLKSCLLNHSAFSIFQREPVGMVKASLVGQGSMKIDIASDNRVTAFHGSVSSCWPERG